MANLAISKPKIAVVLTAPAGREQNLADTLNALCQMDEQPEAIGIVLDGMDVSAPEPVLGAPDMWVWHRPKHEPGREQPRNAGVRMLMEQCPGLTHVWFLDSDILVGADTLTAYQRAIAQVGSGTILIGPYEWMAEGQREPHPEMRTDFRWPMFDERGLGPHSSHLGVALGCFGGNLVWPLDWFMMIGGFHRMLHHGRCEDGELGLRAASYAIPMALVADARGYHMAHPIDTVEAERRNMRDVPLLNSWHPWVEERGLVVTAKDGARFDFVCSCGQQVNTLEMWRHEATHQGVKELPASWDIEPISDGFRTISHVPDDDLILPDDLR